MCNYRTRRGSMYEINWHYYTFTSCHTFWWITKFIAPTQHTLKPFTHITCYHVAGHGQRLQKQRSKRTTYVLYTQHRRRQRGLVITLNGISGYPLHAAFPFLAYQYHTSYDTLMTSSMWGANYKKSRTDDNIRTS